MALNFDQVRDAAQGRWKEVIFPAFAIQVPAKKNQHGPCPICGGKDRFRCDDKQGKGTWICNQCNAGDGFALIEKARNMDYSAVLQEVGAILGLSKDAKITEADRERWRKKAEADRLKAEQDEIRANEAAAKRAERESKWRSFDRDCPYLERKQVKNFGCRINGNGHLIVPLFDINGKIWNLQTIHPDGFKPYLNGGRINHCFYMLGQIVDPQQVICIAEGYATAASIHEATGYTTVVSFQSSNVDKVGIAIRTKYPNAHIVYCADDDSHSNPPDAGLKAANKAVAATGGQVILPDFSVVNSKVGHDGIAGQPQASSKHPSDFNDLHVLAGLSEVRRQIEEKLNSSDPVASPPRTPPTKAGQTLGEMSGDNVEEFNQVIDLKESDFNLDFAPPMNEKPKTERANSKEMAEIIEFERPEFSLEKCLGRFMLVEGKTDIWDDYKKKVIKSLAFTKMVGKSVASRWQAHPNRKMIDADALKRQIDDQNANDATDLLSRFVHLEGTLESWDTVNRERIKNIAIKEAYPNHYEIWAKSPHRRMIRHVDLVFDPTNSTKEHQINIFTGLEVTALTDPDCPDQLLPIKDAYERSKSFIDLLRHLCGEEKAAFAWLLRWLAYPLQNKGAKMATSVLMHGDIHGAGKSLFFGAVMEKIYTIYHKTLDQRDLESQYNDWAEQVLYLLFEEISNNKTKHGMMGFIKHLITGSTLSIHQKFLASMRQANHMNCVFLSNHTQPLPIEENDRRFLVLYPKSTLPPELLERVARDLQSKEAIQAFYTALLQVDLTGFDAHTKPPMTEAKRDIIEYTKAGYDTFVTQWIKGETEFPYVSCTSMQLYDAYQKWSKRTNEHIVSQKRFMGEAKKYGIVSTPDQKHWRMPKGKKGQTKVIMVGLPPDNVPLQDWLGEQIDKFDKAFDGGDNVPMPL
ncbi:toprim domain-containing protein [Acinetobacter baumannii]|uniref:DUF5906 domain-containing protein n=1 Tax=Acinetobacter baumannii TaxID=470 RepID=UPI00189B3727|nr:toprim domain-containing protein [Acinetobacter baumannii]MDC3924708.1 toprim domain-containing protein [Acinetobacter baumannii]MDC4006716.1 toprim domain-containing protein [Acinetobacter baumannii]MDC4020943.1 toprim domain-containing protein [Acinetobacter baumannii]MDC4032244.1 toprim domain-containing protein [Acinetobacter baumannii]